MICSVIDNNTLKEYDDNFAICDDIDVISSKINKLLHTEEEEEKDNEQETLSQREKEIITCVVKGMTNKAIADKLYLSDRKSTRLNSSHVNISYAVFCLKKKKNK